MRAAREKTLSLAAILQSLDLVDKLATSGQCDSEAFAISINSIFITSPDNYDQVYAGVANLERGLRLISLQLSEGEQDRRAQLMRYVITVIHLERKLSRQSKLLGLISSGIERCHEQRQLFGETHENVIANLADIYLNTVSTLTPRVMVTGDQATLQRADITNKVRSLLLAAMRGAILWRQAGAGRLQLLFGRGAFVSEAQRLLNEEILVATPPAANG